MENHKKLPQPLLGVTWFYMLTSVLGIISYAFLANLCAWLSLYESPIVTFGSRCHVYLFMSAVLEDNFPTAVSLASLAISVLWYIALLISCIKVLRKKNYCFFQVMVFADIIGTFGYIVYAVIRDDFYWRWFFTELGWVLNVLYFAWLRCTLRVKSQKNY